MSGVFRSREKLGQELAEGSVSRRIANVGFIWDQEDFCYHAIRIDLINEIEHAGYHMFTVPNELMSSVYSALGGKHA